MRHLASLSTLTLIALAAALPAVESSPDPYGKVTQECPGMWVRSATTTYSITYRASSTVSKMIQREGGGNAEPSEKELDSDIPLYHEYEVLARPDLVRAYMSSFRYAGGGSAVNRTGLAKRDDEIVVRWKPEICPVQPRDVKVIISGSADLSAFGSVNSVRARDYASATASYSAVGEGEIQGPAATTDCKQQIGVSLKVGLIKGSSGLGAEGSGEGKVTLENPHKDPPSPVWSISGLFNAALNGKYVYFQQQESDRPTSLGNTYQVTVLHSKAENTGTKLIYSAFLSVVADATNDLDASGFSFFEYSRSKSKADAKNTITLKLVD